MPGLPQPDFLRPVARPGALAWAWCATGLLVLLATALDSHAAWQLRAQALARLAHASAAAVAVVPAPRPEAQARSAEAQRWLQQLAQPWPAVWAASELAPDGIHWLALSHGAAAGLRLSGLATDLASAQAAAQALRDQQQQGRPLWRGVALATVERVPTGQRFVLVARLADPVAAGAQ